jgi:ABC-3C protein
MRDHRAKQRQLPKIKTKAPAVAPAQALGYGLQQTRLVYQLLRAAPGTSCSLEVLDDVGEQTANGTAHLTQTKSALAGNPATDRSVELWKTLHNWHELVAAGLADVTKTSFTLYVSKPVRGNVVDRLSSAKTPAGAKQALDYARLEMWGAAPGFPLRKSLPIDLAKHVNPLLEAPEAPLLSIIQNFTLECGSGSPHTDLLDELRKQFVSSSSLDDLANEACGWVKRNLEMQLEKQAVAVVSRDEFHITMTAFVRKIEHQAILRSFAPPPTEAEKLAHLPSIFVRQLDLIEIDFDTKLSAISDFLRAGAARAEWSTQGNVHESSFDDLDSQLQRTWRNNKLRAKLNHAAQGPVAEGQALYVECSGHRTRVQNMEPPDYFVPGCFQRLADEKTIGWHPDYVKHLKEKATQQRVK